MEFVEYSLLISFAVFILEYPIFGHIIGDSLRDRFLTYKEKLEENEIKIVKQIKDETDNKKAVNIIRKKIGYLEKSDELKGEYLDLLDHVKKVWGFSFVIFIVSLVQFLDFWTIQWDNVPILPYPLLALVLYLAFTIHSWFSLNNKITRLELGEPLERMIEEGIEEETED